MDIQDGDLCKDLVTIDSKAASIPMPKLNYVSRLRTKHLVCYDRRLHRHKHDNKKHSRPTKTPSSCTTKRSRPLIILPAPTSAHYVRRKYQKQSKMNSIV